MTLYWGYCGVMAFADDQPIAHLTVAPAMYVPRLGAFATTPVGPDAAVVMSAHVSPELRGKGLGKQLVQSVAGLVARRDIRALEAVGTYHDGPVSACASDANNSATASMRTVARRIIILPQKRHLAGVPMSCCRAESGYFAEWLG